MSLKKRFVFSRKTIIVASVITTVALASLGAGIAISQQNKVKNAGESTEQPQFSTILPRGKSINSLGGWSRISPPSSEPVFAYNDKVGTVPITVSEQPLPKSFEGNIDNQVADLAKKYSANNQLSGGSTKAYIGSSSKGPQSVIFTKNNLLILIKSQQKIDDKEWSKYIETLN